VRDLTVAWIHVPGRSTRGLQGGWGALLHRFAQSNLCARRRNRKGDLVIHSPSSMRRWSPGRPTRPTIAARRSATARCS
jgi:hypothetical protein